jgi:hypothetical protein
LDFNFNVTGTINITSLRRGSWKLAKGISLIQPEEFRQFFRFLVRRPYVISLLMSSSRCHVQRTHYFDTSTYFAVDCQSVTIQNAEAAYVVISASSNGPRASPYISLDKQSLADSSTTETKADDAGNIYAPAASQGNHGRMVLDLGSISGDLAAGIILLTSQSRA